MIERIEKGYWWIGTTRNPTGVYCLRSRLPQMARGNGGRLKTYWSPVRRGAWVPGSYRTLAGALIALAFRSS